MQIHRPYTVYGHIGHWSGFKGLTATNKPSFLAFKLKRRTHTCGQANCKQGVVFVELLVSSIFSAVASNC